MNDILDFRNGTRVEVLINNKWFPLLEFTNASYGIKFKHIKKPFNPYHTFDIKNTILINNYLKK